MSSLPPYLPPSPPAYNTLSDEKKRRHYDRFGPEETEGQDSSFDFDAFYKFGGGDSGFQHHAHFNFHMMFDDSSVNPFGNMFQDSQSHDQCDGGGGEGWICIGIMYYYIHTSYVQ